MKRDQFTFYRSYYEALKNLPKRDQTAVLMAVIGYALDETEPLLSGVPLSVFTLIRPTLDSGRNKARNRMNKCGTRSDQTDNKVKTNQERTFKEGEKEVESESEREVEVESEKESENDSYTSPTPSSRGKRFSPPTVDEVRAYCQERNNGVDPESFVSFYASKGWTIGPSPMKDWKQAVITWEKRRKQEGKEKPTAQSMNDETWKYIREMYRHKEEP